MKKGYRNQTCALAAVLPDIISHKGWKVKLDMYSFFPDWEQIVAGNAAACSRPLKIKKDTLWVEVENSSWMQQLQYEKYQILADINARLKFSRIKDIKFTLPEGDRKEPKPERARLTFVSPDPQEVERFEKQIESIEDDRTRKAIFWLWYLSRSCKRKKR
ncbi:MAG: hypothetical protein CSA26_10950 [Desulfobacterales bacterium]|nr:MAG: hypothetical protein CSA26_10950 [Desulfobacterales bacterium]